MNAPLCTHCGASITEAYNINYTWLVVCESCNTPHFLWVDDGTYRKIPKPRFNLTRRFNVYQKPDGVAIRYRKPRSNELFFLSLIWFALLVIAFAASPIPVLAFRLILIAAVMMFGYAILRLIVNRTTILLAPKHIHISEGPLPPIWKFILKNPIMLGIAPKFADRDLSHKQMIDINAIEQVYCTEDIIVDGEGGSQTLFDVQLKNKSGTEILLISGLDTHEEALFIEQGIKQLYHIETKPYPALGTFQFSD